MREYECDFIESVIFDKANNTTDTVYIKIFEMLESIFHDFDISKCQNENVERNGYIYYGKGDVIYMCKKTMVDISLMTIFQTDDICYLIYEYLIGVKKINVVDVKYDENIKHNNIEYFDNLITGYIDKYEKEKLILIDDTVAVDNLYWKILFIDEQIEDFILAEWIVEAYRKKCKVNDYFVCDLSGNYIEEYIERL